RILFVLEKYFAYRRGLRIAVHSSLLMSLGQQDVGREGAPTGRREFSLPSFMALCGVSSKLFILLDKEYFDSDSSRFFSRSLRIFPTLILKVYIKRNIL